MVIEYHFNLLNDRDKSKYFEIVNILKSNFNKVIYNQEPKKAWTTIITVLK